MKIFPQRKLILLSPLKPDEAALVLAGAIENRKGWKKKFLSSGSGKFCGEVAEGCFLIFRDIKYDSLYQPRIYGVISPDENANSRIDVAMKLKPATSIFLGVWLAGIAFTALNALAVLATSNGKPSYTFVLMAALFAAAAYGRVMMGFRPEALKAEEFLIATLQATPIQPVDLSRQAI